jgi:hypothetical protein
LIASHDPCALFDEPQTPAGASAPLGFPRNGPRRPFGLAGLRPGAHQKRCKITRLLLASNAGGASAPQAFRGTIRGGHSALRRYAPTPTINVRTIKTPHASPQTSGSPTRPPIQGAPFPGRALNRRNAPASANARRAPWRGKAKWADAHAGA